MLNEISWFKSNNKSGRTANILLGGDMCPVRNYEKKILSGEDIFDAPLLQKMKAPDMFVVNLETPLTEIKAETGFSSSVKVGEYLKKIGVDVAGLANNHIRDRGDAGVLQTIDTLKKNNIAPVGAGENEKIASRMLIKRRNGIKIGILAFAEREFNLATENRPGAAFLDPYKVAMELPAARKKVDFLLLFLHSGDEFILTPPERTRKIYRLMVKHGADVVVGHHPHVPQGIEKYKGKWIFYSLGNLVFDSDYVSTYKNTDHGYMVELDFGEHSISSIKVIPYYLRKNFIVESVTDDELKWYKSLLTDIGNNIIDEKKFRAEHEKNTQWKFNEFTRKHLSDFQKRFYDINDNNYLRIIHNLFNCPTHVESLKEAFGLVREGKIDRKF
jgi:poly-gamma-glutamate synthesis protein (capsule biosynthesis protein)